MAKKTKYYTGLGTAVWAHLNTPDEFRGKKQFKATMAFEDEVAEDEKTRMKKLVDEAFDELTADLNPGQIKKIKKRYPFSKEEDDEGEETGRTLVTFSQNAVIKGKPATVALFDWQGKPMSKQIWGRSTMRVCYSCRPYLMWDDDDAGNKKGKLGITVDLISVKVKDLVSGAGAGDSSGFGDEDDADDGYDASGDPDDDGGAGDDGDEADF